jgi:hypothetical protein
VYVDVCKNIIARISAYGCTIFCARPLAGACRTSELPTAFRQNWGNGDKPQLSGFFGKLSSGHLLWNAATVPPAGSEGKIKTVLDPRFQASLQELMPLIALH